MVVRRRHFWCKKGTWTSRFPRLWRHQYCEILIRRIAVCGDDFFCLLVLGGYYFRESWRCHFHKILKTMSFTTACGPLSGNLGRVIRFRVPATTVNAIGRCCNAVMPGKIPTCAGMTFFGWSCPAGRTGYLNSRQAASRPRRVCSRSSAVCTVDTKRRTPGNTYCPCFISRVSSLRIET